VLCFAGTIPDDIMRVVGLKALDTWSKELTFYKMLRKAT
jgi:hypothetical protein